MHLPTNMLESEVLAIIDEVVKGLAHSFAFGYYDSDDLYQEGRIFAIEALHLYDATRGASLKTFLHNRVKQRFINLRRNKYYRPIPDNISEDKLERLVKRNNIKRSLIDVSDIEEDSIEQFSETTDSIQQKELFKFIDKHLPVELRADYRCILEEVKIPKHRKIKVLEVLREMLNEREEKG
jgi:RNA polymerase sigma factor (sigma-70 family)